MIAIKIYSHTAKEESVAETHASHLIQENLPLLYFVENFCE